MSAPALCAAAAAAAVALAPFAARASTAVDPRLRVSVEERYDDDALLVESGAGQLMTKLTPQAGLDVRTRTFESTGWYAADLVMRHGSGTFTADHRGRGQFRLELSDTAWLDGSVSAWRVSDPTSLPRLGVARTLSPVLYGRADVGAHLRATDRWTTGLRYTFEGAQVFDGRSAPGTVHTPQLEGWYRLTRTTDLGLEGRFQWFAFGTDSAQAGSAGVALRHRFSRQVYGLVRGGAGLFAGPGETLAHPYPRASVELGRDGERLDLGLILGHDLMGASGFTTALWADYGSVVADWHVLEPLKLYGAASVYRNGRAPDVGFWSQGLAGSGYGLGVGVEWRMFRAVGLQVQADRYAQIGAPDSGAVDLARNVVSARVIVTPFGGAPGTGW